MHLVTDVQLHSQNSGLDWILQCARERSQLPSRRYTCLEGIRVLATGFDKKTKAHIQHLVSAMCGELYSNSSMEVDIVVAKDVLAPKYKWSAFELRKPIVSLDWLVQSFQQHRRAPHEPYKLQTFAGLKVCATGILIDTRDKIAALIVSNGGSFDPDLTRECTHLIVKITDSDKYRVAKRHWCTIKLVNEQWFWDSLSEKVCLEESSYPPQEGTIGKPIPPQVIGLQNSSLPELRSATSGPVTTTSNDPNQDQRSAGVGTAKHLKQPNDASSAPVGNDANTGEMGDYLSGCRIFLAGFEPAQMKRLLTMVLDGGGTRYMEFHTRITHVIFGKPSESDMKDIRQYALWGAVHVVFPAWLEECSRQRSEVVVSERFSVPHILLAQENYSKQEISKWRPVYQEKSLEEAYGGVPRLQPGVVSDKSMSLNQTRPSSHGSNIEKDTNLELVEKPPEGPSYQVKSMEEEHDGKSAEGLAEVVTEERPFISPRKGDGQQGFSTPAIENPITVRLSAPRLPGQQISETDNLVGKVGSDVQELVSIVTPTHLKPKGLNIEPGFTDSTALDPLPRNQTTYMPSVSGRQKKVFDGCVFEFAETYEIDARAEIVQWVNEGGGKMLINVEEGTPQKVDYLIVPHGLKKGGPRTSSSPCTVTLQWIKFCLEEGSILDTASHILFKPLPCEIPLPGFERYRFCVSQYADRDRILLYNLCHVLGAKLQEKRMTKKATHLLCMVGDGEKYEAALRWGIEAVTADWVHACVTRNMVVDHYLYRPKKLTAADREAGLAIPTQLPKESVVSGVGDVDDIEQSKQHNKPEQAEEQGNERDIVEVKGKTANNKRSSSRGRSNPGSLEFQPPSAHKQANVPLSSQMIGGNLDPWDQLTASWSNQQDNEKRPSTRFQQNIGISSQAVFKEPASVGRSKIRIIGPENTREGKKSVKFAQEEPRSVADKKAADTSVEEESGPDVAAAIEGLLAQSSKAQSSDVSRTPDDQTIRSSVPRSLNRRRDDAHPHSNFKRPKLLPNRSPFDFDEEELPQSTVSGEDVHEDFSESQIVSQVVAYDEDFSGKQRIMERVKTRRMCTTTTVRSGGDVPGNEKIMWKDASLSRLFKAAAATN